MARKQNDKVPGPSPSPSLAGVQAGADGRQYESLEGEFAASITIERSVFNAIAEHVTSEDQVFDRLEEIRRANPKARHTVWAYVLHDGTYRASDDGEPQGTAGKPTLAVLQHEGLADVALYTTRYFGGVLLGAGGLVRAYTKAAQDCLANADRVRYASCSTATISVSYAQYAQAARIVQDCGGTVESPAFSDHVTLTVAFLGRIPATLQAKISELTNGASTVKAGPVSIRKISAAR